MTTKTMKSLARSMGKALKAKGHVVPHSVLLHVLAASSGKSNWHVLAAKKEDPETPPASWELRAALINSAAMLKESRPFVEKDTGETIDRVLVQIGEALGRADGPALSARVIEAAKLVIARWDKGDLAEAVRKLDRALAGLGREPLPTDSVFQTLLKAAEDVLQANGGMPPDWMADEAVALEAAINAARNFQPDPHAGKPEDIWASDEQFPVEDWRYEVENDDTRRGYWDWVASQREQAQFERNRLEQERGNVAEQDDEEPCSCHKDPVTGKNYGVNPHCREHGEHRCECANCSAIWDINELNEIKRYWERVDENDEYQPDGECPNCGSLCYLIGEPSIEQVLNAAQALIEDYDDTGGEECGVVTESIYNRFAAILNRFRATTDAQATFVSAAQEVINDYQTEGRENCGTISEPLLTAFKATVEQVRKA
jgi:hypothetical protein